MLPLVATGALAAGMQARANSGEDDQPTEIVFDSDAKPATQDAPAFTIAQDARLEWPGNDRSDLRLPDDLWDAVRKAVRQSDQPIGYERDVMDHYGSTAYRLDSIELLFADVADLPRESGRLTDGLLNAAAQTLASDPNDGSRGEAVPGPAEVARLAYILTDVRAGRGYRVPGQLPAAPAGNATEDQAVAIRRETILGALGPGATGGWGVDWLADDVTPAEAMKTIAARSAGAVDPASLEAFAALPFPAQRLAVRLYLGAHEVDRWLQIAFRDAEQHVLQHRRTLPLGNRTPTSSLIRAAGGSGSGGGGANDGGSGGGGMADDLHFWSADEWYDFVMLPWDDARSASADPAALTDSIRLLDHVDRIALGYATVVYLTHVQRAIDEYRQTIITAIAADQPQPAAITEPVSIETDLGRIRVHGIGEDVIAESLDGRDLIVVDLGGNDTWQGGLGRSAGPVLRTSAAIDLGGDDTWGTGDEAGAFGCGLLGIGLAWDVAGNDHYQIRESGLGCGWYGTGLLVDTAGNDRYAVDRGWAQAHAVAGVAALIDVAGNDEYVCGFEAQAHGSTLGAAVLVDTVGDDAYIARDDGRVSELYLNQSVAMAQGCGHGRRADLDLGGHSLSGGWGVLVDGEGNDRYHSQVWSQGAGYWWGVGILEDRGGDDHYRNGKYSLGAGAHFAIGVQVDLAGDDRYNVDNDTAVNQYQGHARDGSIGVSIDGSGNDHYKFRNHCGGSADLGSIGLFWDRRGNDTYVYEPNDFGPANGWAETPPMGSATIYPEFRSFRDEVFSTGIFLDTGGQDRYPDRFGRIGWGDNVAWQRNRGRLSWSWAWDGQLWRD